VITALRYTRFTLVVDIVVMLALAIGLSGASWLGLNIEPFKWTVVFDGGVLMGLAAFLSVAAIVLQIIVALRRRPEVR
jgi:hypothetical protein